MGIYNSYREPMSIYEAVSSSEDLLSVRGMIAVKGFYSPPTIPPYFLRKEYVNLMHEKPVREIYITNVAYDHSKKTTLQVQVPDLTTHSAGKNCKTITDKLILDIEVARTEEHSWSLNQAISVGVSASIGNAQLLSI